MAMNHAVFESESADQDDVAEPDRDSVRGAYEFDDLVTMAAHLAGVSTATLCIAESDRLRLAASHPAPLPPGAAVMLACDVALWSALDRETPVLHIADARSDARCEAMHGTPEAPAFVLG